MVQYVYFTLEWGDTLLWFSQYSITHNFVCWSIVCKLVNLHKIFSTTFFKFIWWIMIALVTLTIIITFWKTRVIQTIYSSISCCSLFYWFIELWQTFCDSYFIVSKLFLNSVVLKCHFWKKKFKCLSWHYHFFLKWRNINHRHYVSWVLFPP